jgi:hypothetical protein
VDSSIPQLLYRRRLSPLRGGKFLLSSICQPPYRRGLQTLCGGTRENSIPQPMNRLGMYALRGGSCRVSSIPQPLHHWHVHALGGGNCWTSSISQPLHHQDLRRNCSRTCIACPCHHRGVCMCSLCDGIVHCLSQSLCKGSSGSSSGSGSTQYWRHHSFSSNECTALQGSVGKCLQS